MGGGGGGGAGVGWGLICKLWQKEDRPTLYYQVGV